jgi:hypothetical protein
MKSRFVFRIRDLLMLQLIVAYAITIWRLEYWVFWYNSRPGQGLDQLLVLLVCGTGGALFGGWVGKWRLRAFVNGGAIGGGIALIPLLHIFWLLVHYL